MKESKKIFFILKQLGACNLIQVKINSVDVMRVN
jgi:hypothetical protein